MPSGNISKGPDDLEFDMDVSDRHRGEEEEDRNKPTYCVTDVPPWYLCMFLAVQHYLTSFGAMTSIPLILSEGLCLLHDSLTQSRFINTSFFASGLITLLQASHPPGGHLCIADPVHGHAVHAGVALPGLDPERQPGQRLLTPLHRSVADPHENGVKEVDQVLRILLTTNMFVGGVLGFFLDNTIPGTKRERGLLAWSPEDPEDSVCAARTQEVYDLPFGITSRLSSRPWVRLVPFCPWRGTGSRTGSEDHGAPRGAEQPLISPGGSGVNSLHEV
ncbi:solute carrier family 23 member 1-like [Pseudoliparis swirei]|uniref:solute carrier family 23 member 1-like n=1 Tax=Pseudoliparis swirei TaxID=2059687 RepID=UPI0024BE3F9F|nr:solute carrier family 23 member 1-like [Pseudoliparis swirei]